MEEDNKILRDQYKTTAERPQVKRNNQKYILKREEVYNFDKPNKTQPTEFEL